MLILLKTDQTNIDSISNQSWFKSQDDDLSIVSRGAGWRCCVLDKCADAECCWCDCGREEASSHPPVVDISQLSGPSQSCERQ